MNLISKIPEQFRETVIQVCDKLCTKLPDVKAVILIGSVAEGDFQEDSDVDLVYVSRRELSFRELLDTDKEISPKVQLVPLTQTSLKEHFRNHSTMAHAIQKGIILYERDHYLAPFLKKSLGPPDPQWMKKWFLHWMRFYYLGLRDRDFAEELHTKYCQEECHCHVSDEMARVAVNLMILWLETQGVVPTTKGQVWRYALNLILCEKHRQALKLALEVCHQDRVMNFKEMGQVKELADWLKRELMGLLHVTKDELQEMEDFYAKLSQPAEDSAPKDNPPEALSKREEGICDSK